MFIITAILLLGVIGSSVSSELQDIKQLARSQNDFAFNLFKTFSTNQNLFFSPISIYIALAMLYRGTNTKTAEELQRVMGYDRQRQANSNIHQTVQELLDFLENTSDEIKLEIANAIVCQTNSTILAEYKEALQKYYKALLIEADFLSEADKAKDIVNSWVKEKTHGKITKLLEELSSDARLILLNAVYFKGKWKTQFNSRDTATDTFYNNGVHPAQVPMMNVNSKFLYGYFQDDGFEVVQLPYKGDTMTMTIILPLRKGELPSIEQSLNYTKVDNTISQLRNIKQLVTIPKFKLEYGKTINENLMQLGINSVFGNTADLSGISRRERLKVSKIEHKAVIEVNEEGSEAAAVTSVQVVTYSVSPSFYANHPFIFIIREEKTGLVLFIGRVNNL